METVRLTKEDLSTVKWLKKRLAEGHSFFVARKSGSNARGRGVNRSVILGKAPGRSNWHQSAKIWGFENEKRAAEIMRLARLTPNT